MLVWLLLFSVEGQAPYLPYLSFTYTHETLNSGAHQNAMIQVDIKRGRGLRVHADGLVHKVVPVENHADAHENVKWVAFAETSSACTYDDSYDEVLELLGPVREFFDLDGPMGPRMMLPQQLDLVTNEGEYTVFHSNLKTRSTGNRTTNWVSPRACASACTQPRAVRPAVSLPCDALIVVTTKAGLPVRIERLHCQATRQAIPSASSPLIGWRAHFRTATSAPVPDTLFALPRGWRQDAPQTESPKCTYSGMRVDAHPGRTLTTGPGNCDRWAISLAAAPDPTLNLGVVSVELFPCWGCQNCFVLEPAAFQMNLTDWDVPHIVQVQYVKDGRGQVCIRATGGGYSTQHEGYIPVFACASNTVGQEYLTGPVPACPPSPALLFSSSPPDDDSSADDLRPEVPPCDDVPLLASAPHGESAVWYGNPWTPLGPADPVRFVSVHAVRPKSARIQWVRSLSAVSDCGTSISSVEDVALYTYTVSVRRANQKVWTALPPTTETFLILTDLKASTPYEVQITAVAGYPSLERSAAELVAFKTKARPKPAGCPPACSEDPCLSTIDANNQCVVDDPSSSSPCPTHTCICEARGFYRARDHRACRSCPPPCSTDPCSAASSSTPQPLMSLSLPDLTAPPGRNLCIPRLDRGGTGCATYSCSCSAPGWQIHPDGLSCVRT